MRKYIRFITEWRGRQPGAVEYAGGEHDLLTFGQADMLIRVNVCEEVTEKLVVKTRDKQRNAV